MKNDAYMTPTEVKDYTIEWDAPWTCGGPVLAPGEAIVSSSWAYTNVNGDNALNVAADAPTIDDNGQLTTVWLTGGTPGQMYSVTNTIVTNNLPERTLTRTFSCFVNAANSL